jgi:hypothetical protein
VTPIGFQGTFVEPAISPRDRDRVRSSERTLAQASAGICSGVSKCAPEDNLKWNVVRRTSGFG